MPWTNRKHKPANKNKIYDRSWKGRLYGRRWREYSKSALADNPYCAMCGVLAEVTDHVIPHGGDEEKFWDCSNHQSLCKSCHDRKTQGGG